MVLHISTYIYLSAVLLIIFFSCFFECNAFSLLERLNNNGADNVTDQSPLSEMAGNMSYAEMSPTDFSPLEAKTCSSINATVLHNFKVLTEIRKVGETCRRHCGKDSRSSGGTSSGSSSGGNQISSELGEFSRRLQLLQLTVEGLALMLDDAMERLEEPHAPEFLKSPYPKDCTEILYNGETTSGVYTIHPEGCGPPFQVYCDMDTDDGGWSVFQRRQDGSEDFDRGWGSYRRGFGDLSGEFWLGNDKLYRLSFQDEYELRIDMEMFNGTTSYVKYSNFWLGDVHAKYRLHIGEFNGTTGDSLEYHNELPFTAIDKDNDLSYTNCAEIYSGAWWFNGCHYSNLNGRYLAEDTDSFAKGIVWYEFSGFYSSLKRCDMKIRAKL